MSSVRIDIRPGFERDLARHPGVRSAAARIGRRIADEATRLGRQVATTYEAVVEVDDEGVHVGGRTRARATHMNLGKSIEHGTWRKPATAPLRRGADAAGLRTGPAR